MSGTAAPQSGKWGIAHVPNGLIVTRFDDASINRTVTENGHFAKGRAKRWVGGVVVLGCLENKGGVGGFLA